LSPGIACALKTSEKSGCIPGYGRPTRPYRRATTSGAWQEVCNENAESSPWDRRWEKALSSTGRREKCGQEFVFSAQPENQGNSGAQVRIRDGEELQPGSCRAPSRNLRTAWERHGSKSGGRVLALRKVEAFTSVSGGAKMSRADPRRSKGSKQKPT